MDEFTKEEAFQHELVERLKGPWRTIAAEGAGGDGPKTIPEG